MAGAGEMEYWYSLNPLSTYEYARISDKLMPGSFL